MDPLITSALLSSGAGLLGGLFSTKSTNDLNYQIAKMNNEYNLRSQREAQNWNYKMWLENNQYNSPIQQVQRLAAAGINPYLNGSIGSGTSSMMPQTDPVTASPYKAESPAPYITGSLGQLSDMLFNYSNITADANLKNSNASYYDMKTTMERAQMAANLVKLKHEAKSAKERSSIDRLERQFLESTFGERVAQTYQTTDLMRAQYLREQANTALVNLQSEAQKIGNLYLPNQLAANLSKTLADVRLSAAQAGLSLAQARLAVKQAITETYRSEGLNISNSQARQLVDILVDDASYQRDINKVKSLNIYQYGSTEFTNSYDVTGELSSAAKAGIPGIASAGYDAKVSGRMTGARKVR